MAKLSLRMKVELYENFLNDIANRHPEEVEIEALKGPEVEDGRKNYPYAFGYVLQDYKSVIATARYALVQGAKK